MSRNYSPILYDYLRKYQENPRSRVFAPLAEAYRKAGLIDEAIDIAREGMRIHPGFTGGRVALARALFEKKQYVEVIEELELIVRDVPDNLVAQRLLAESALMLGRVTQALDAYKMLLYFTPSDTELVRIVQELEVHAYEKGTLVLETQPARLAPSPLPDFQVQTMDRVIPDDPTRKRAAWIRQVELLQDLLQRVERYRQDSSHR